MVLGIVNFKCLSIFNSLVGLYPQALWSCFENKDWLGLTDKLFESQDFSEELNATLNQWFNIRPDPNKKKNSQFQSKLQQGEEMEMEDEEDAGALILLESRILDDVLPEFERLNMSKNKRVDYVDGLSIDDCESFLRASESIIKEIRVMDVNPNKRKEYLLDTQTKIRVARNRKLLLERIFLLRKSERIELPDVEQLLRDCEALTNESEKKDLLENIDLKQRWALFFAVVDRAQTTASNRIPRIEMQLIHEQKKLQQCYLYAKGLLLQNAQVVGMTTTGAAKYRELVKMMQSKIGSLNL